MVRILVRVGVVASLVAAVSSLGLLARWYRIHHGPATQITGRVVVQVRSSGSIRRRLQAEAIRFEHPFGPPSYAHRLSLYDGVRGLVDRVVLPGRQPRPLTLPEVRHRLVISGQTGEAVLASAPGLPPAPDAMEGPLGAP